MEKPRITLDKSLTTILFAKLGVDKDDESTELFCGSSINTYITLTPIEKEYMIIEEWDEKDELSIKIILDEDCQGRIGSTSDGTGGEDFSVASCNALLLLIGSLKLMFQVIIGLLNLALNLLLVFYLLQESLIYDPLNPKYPVTKLTSKFLPLVTAKFEDPSYTHQKDDPERLSQLILRRIQFLEEGAKYTQDKVKDLKLENNALISKLEKTEQNVEN